MRASTLRRSPRAPASSGAWPARACSLLPAAAIGGRAAAMEAHQKPSRLVRGATGDWEVVVGLEVHAQVTSRAKLFSGASTEFGGAPNSHVSLVDAAMPGM